MVVRTGLSSWRKEEVEGEVPDGSNRSRADTGVARVGVNNLLTGGMDMGGYALLRLEGKQA